MNASPFFVCVSIGSTRPKEVLNCTVVPFYARAIAAIWALLLFPRRVWRRI